jgi:hypothetical protein
MKFQYEREDGVVTTTNIWYSEGLKVWRWTCTSKNEIPCRQFSGQGEEFSEVYSDILDTIVDM